MHHVVPLSETQLLQDAAAPPVRPHGLATSRREARRIGLGTWSADRRGRTSSSGLAAGGDRAPPDPRPLHTRGGSVARFSCGACRRRRRTPYVSDDRPVGRSSVGTPAAWRPPRRPHEEHRLAVTVMVSNELARVPQRGERRGRRRPIRHHDASKSTDGIVSRRAVGLHRVRRRSRRGPADRDEPDHASASVKASAPWPPLPIHPGRPRMAIGRTGCCRPGPRGQGQGRGLPHLGLRRLHDPRHGARQL